MEIKVTEWLQSKCKFQLSKSILVRVNECNQNARSNKVTKRVKATCFGVRRWPTPVSWRGSHMDFLAAAMVGVVV